MNSDDLTKAIKHLKPSAEFSFQEADYSTIQWDVLEGKAPSLAEIEKAYLQVKAMEEAAQAETIAKRAALLERLGITQDEAKLLLA